MKKLNSTQFLNLEPEFTQYEHSKYIIQQLPYEYTSSYKTGSEFGPQAMIDASHYVELYDEETKAEAYKSGISTLEALNFSNKINEEAINIIEAATADLLDDNKFIISLAAEHTATYGIIKAFKNKYKNFSVLQIDAHADLRDAYYDSENKLNKYSHACVMHRIHELNIPISQVGIRALSKEEDELIQSSSNINTIYSHDIDEFSYTWIQEVIKNITTDNVYITIDADGLDPSIAPAVGTPEPGGLSYKDILQLLQTVAKNKNIIGFDVLECAPIKNSIITEYTLSKIIYKLISYIEKYSNK